MQNQNQLPAKNDIKHELIMPIDTLLKAKKTTLISQCSNEEIGKRLSLIYFMIGLRPQHFPSPEEDLFIFNYLRINYGHKTLDELYLAFDLAIKGTTEVDCKVYDQFSITTVIYAENEEEAKRFALQKLTQDEGLNIGEPMYYDLELEGVFND